MIKKILLLLFGVLCSVQCQTPNPKKATPLVIPDGYESAYFASGCFWCVEGVYEKVYGVSEVVSGYAGGQEANPSYYNHGNHAETVAVIYDPNKVTYTSLLHVFFDITNPYTVGQAPDFGSSYRSILFPKNQQQQAVIDSMLIPFDGHKIEIQRSEKHPFTIAEDYHQNYVQRLEKGEKVVNPSYGLNVSLPRRKAFIDKTNIRLKEN
ncbi:MAG: peptide-methionine (S)-S-oxide reductase MsrA [Flavobacteriaceae bacterium]